MSLQNVFQWGLLGVVAVLAVMAYNKPATMQTVVEKLGAAAGPEVTEPTFFRGTVTPGGNVVATSSQGAATYTAANFLNTSVIQHTATAALTATLPASSTLKAFVPLPGDTRVMYLNPITTGITLAGGTGTEFNTASSTKFCVVGSLCRLDFIRKTNTDIEVLFTSATGL